MPLMTNVKMEQNHISQEKQMQKPEESIEERRGFTCVVCGGEVPESPIRYQLGGNSHYCSKRCRDDDGMAM